MEKEGNITWSGTPGAQAGSTGFPPAARANSPQTGTTSSQAAGVSSPQTGSSSS